jgi:SAM-dependent methyltransferase
MDQESPYSRPDLYDLLAPADPAMAAFYLEAATETAGPILDLACGSGRFTVPLARAGHRVVGGDLSSDMLKQARTNAAAAGVTAEFVTLDMRDFDLGRRFALVLVAANTLLHLHAGDDLRRCFQAVRRHLGENGRFAFDIFVPSPAILRRDPVRRFPVETVHHPQLGQVIVEETTRYDRASRISHATWFWSTATARDFWITPVVLRQIFAEELPGLLEAGGLRLIERFGDFRRDPFGPDSFRQVCIAAAA